MPAIRLLNAFVLLTITKALKNVKQKFVEVNKGDGSIFNRKIEPSPGFSRLNVRIPYLLSRDSGNAQCSGGYPEPGQLRVFYLRVR